MTGKISGLSMISSFFRQEELIWTVTYSNSVTIEIFRKGTINVCITFLLLKTP